MFALGNNRVFFPLFLRCFSFGVRRSCCRGYDDGGLQLFCLPARSRSYSVDEALNLIGSFRNSFSSLQK